MMNIRVRNQEPVIKGKNGRYAIRGFTLIELMVSMAIFITIITMAVGALYSAQSINVHLQQTQAILDEVNLAMEIMVRDIRYGTIFYCDTNLPSSVPFSRKSCAYPSGGTVLVFRPVTELGGSLDPTKDRVAYYVSNGVLYKDEYPYGANVVTTQMTSSDIVVNQLSFFAVGAYSKSGADGYDSTNPDFNQPLMTIALSGVTVPPKKSAAPVSFNLESSASSREIDN